jgi:hypothetical protein
MGYFLRNTPDVEEPKPAEEAEGITEGVRRHYAQPHRSLGSIVAELRRTPLLPTATVMAVTAFHNLCYFLLHTFVSIPSPPYLSVGESHSYELSC